jgi:gluconokinase
MTKHIDLTSAPSVLFLFGLSGSGKSYVGDVIGELTGRYTYHADVDITRDMKLALKESRPFTESMRDEYFPVVVEKILSLRQRYGFLIVTQGAYKQRHRDYLEENISDMEMIYISTSDQLISQRLSARSKGISYASAISIKSDFESPTASIKVITNDGGKVEVINQLHHYYPKPPNKTSHPTP